MRIEFLQVRTITTQRIAGRLAYVRNRLLLTASLAAIGGPILFGLASQSNSQNAPRPAFEVASVKLNTTTNSPGWTHFEPAGINIRQASLNEILATAYHVPDSQISSDERMRDVFATRYDIVAKAGHEVPRDLLLLMLQSLLADRFSLTLHHEDKVRSVYKLTVAKGGPKLKESQGPQPRDPNCTPPKCMAFSNIDMWTFAAALTNRMGRPVLDLTGLQGNWDFTLHLDSMDAPAGDDPAPKNNSSDWTMSSIFTDIGKELGLKLESDKAPVETLVIDHVERPSEN